jgi:hypothetical protein
MLHNPDWKEIFAPHGVLLREGEIIRRTNYSRTLEAIGAGGAAVFYNVRFVYERPVIRPIRMSLGPHRGFDHSENTLHWGHYDPCRSYEL